jgi:hypothetical protein
MEARTWFWGVGTWVAAFALACSSGEAFQAADAGASGGAGGGGPDGGNGTTTCNIVGLPIVHGIKPDGRVDVSAAEAWPNRPPEPAAVTPSELLGGCAILTACFQLQIADAGPADDKQIADSLRSCLLPSSHANEERVIPELEQNERWSFNLRTLLAKKGCAGLFMSTQRPPGVTCQEDGCWWNPATPSPMVQCAGEVATLTSAGMSYTRDCSHSYTTCSTTSTTGCTDRPIVTCQSAANDRCDGDIKLGCDRCGMVSYHDCAVMGGHCVENPAGAACVYPSAAQCTPMDQTCAGNLLTACVAGTPVTVDCVALGLKGCTAGHCIKP